MSKSINEIAALVKTVKGNTRTLNRYSDAILAHMEESKGDKEVARHTKSLAQVFNAATTGKTRTTPGMIKTLANNSIAQAPKLREDVVIDRNTEARKRTDSALLRNGGAIVTEGVVDALEKAALRFKALYDGFKEDAVVNADKSLTLDAPVESLEAVTA